MKVAMAPRSGPATARMASSTSIGRSTIRYSPANCRLLAAAHRWEDGDLLVSRERPIPSRVGPVAGEQGPLLAPERRNPRLHAVPDVRKRGVRGHLDFDRWGARGLAVACEEQDGDGHRPPVVPREAEAAMRRLSRTSLSTSPTIASIPAFTSARRVKAGNPGVCTMDLSRSIIKASGVAGGAGTSIVSPSTVRSGISPRLTQPIGFPASRKWRRNTATSWRTARGSPGRANPAEKLTTGP